MVTFVRSLLLTINLHVIDSFTFKTVLGQTRRKSDNKYALSGKVVTLKFIGFFVVWFSGTGGSVYGGSVMIGSVVDVSFTNEMVEFDELEASITFFFIQRNLKYRYCRKNK